MNEWINFNGKYEILGSGKIKLTSRNNDGIIIVSEDNVKFDSSSISLRRDSIVEIVASSKNKISQSSENELSNCSKDCCIGFVKICCDNGRVIGSCVGAWGC
jgi:hypothetical protein